MTSKHVKGLYTLSFTNSTVNGLHIAKGSQLATEKKWKILPNQFSKKVQKNQKIAISKYTTSRYYESRS